MFGAFAGAVTILGVTLQIEARASVTASETLDPTDPLKTIFIVRNESPLAIHRLKIDFRINDLSHREKNIMFRGPVISTDIPEVKELLLGEATWFQILQPTIPPEPYMHGDITFEIGYRPAYLPWRKHQSLRFETLLDANKHVVWLPKAESDTKPLIPPFPK